MLSQEIADKIHSMNPLDYKLARIKIWSSNKEELHEMVLTYINTLSYNGAWDFKVSSEMDGSEFLSIIIFKYNGTIHALDAYQKLHFGYKYRKAFEFIK